MRKGGSHTLPTNLSPHPHPPRHFQCSTYLCHKASLEASPTTEDLQHGVHPGLRWSEETGSEADEYRRHTHISGPGACHTALTVEVPRYTVSLYFSGVPYHATRRFTTSSKPHPHYAYHSCNNSGYPVHSSCMRCAGMHASQHSVRHS